MQPLKMWITTFYDYNINMLLYTNYTTLVFLKKVEPS